MKKHTVVSIKDPCTQDWDAMKPETSGRFCLHCKHAVVDMSGMSLHEIGSYLKDNGKIFCGRFNTAQLGRPLVVKKPKRSIQAIYARIAAACMALFSLKANAKSIFQPNFLNATEAASASKKTLLTEPITIIGVVKDEYGKPLSKANVYFNGMFMAATDSSGKYQFLLPKNSTTALITFECLPYGNQVRNYHIAMASTTFDIIFYEPRGRTGIGGVVSYHDIPDFEKFVFKNNSISLSKESKIHLKQLGKELKQNPEMSVRFSASFKHNKLLAQERVKLLSHLLYQYFGIAEGRIETELLQLGTNSDAVEVFLFQ